VVPRGSLAVVLGNSGSGKTTLLRGIMQVVFCCVLRRKPASHASAVSREEVAAWVYHVTQQSRAYNTFEADLALDCGVQEACRVSGKVAVHGRLAIVTQPAWLQAATIRCYSSCTASAKVCAQYPTAIARMMQAMSAGLLAQIQTQCSCAHADVWIRELHARLCAGKTSCSACPWRRTATGGRSKRAA